jgi:hypothetical protein
VWWWETMLLCSCRKSLATTFYTQCVGEGTRLLMKMLMKYVRVRVLYSVENFSNLEIGSFFNLSHMAQLCLLEQKCTANSTNISIIETEIQICIFKVNCV